MEVFAKKSLFDGARRTYSKGTSQGVRSSRASGLDRRYVKTRHQRSVHAEHRRPRATQVHVSRPEVLASVNGDRPLFSDAGADTVRALDLLGPDAAEPGAPIL